jgi:hypothetical protein
VVTAAETTAKAMAPAQPARSRLPGIEKRV